MSAGRSPAETALAEYLGKVRPDPAWRRAECCGSSRFLYCSECYRLLLPRKDWPSLHAPLPFDVDILLDAKERRGSSSGVHLAVLQRARNVLREQSGVAVASAPTVRLFDAGAGSEPEYDGDPDGTFVLFPSDGSVPVSRAPVRRLIVLDCKWTRTGALRTHTALRRFRRVHLSTQASQSYFWRWHTAGRGMVSTMEAIYYAANEIHGTDGVERSSLLDYMWLFALQRSIIGSKSEQERRPAPYTQAGKDVQRRYREKDRLPTVSTQTE